MSDDKRRDAPTIPLNQAAKDTAKRMGMTEKEYSDAARKLIASGKLNPEHLK